MEGDPPQLPGPGWYPDPNDASSRRYWDGSRWTDNRVPAGTAVTHGAAAPARPTNGMAVAALVLGIVWVCGVGSILALIFGTQARNEIDASGGAEQGRGMATAGIVLGWVGIGIALLYVLIYVIFGAGVLLLGGSNN